jgi:potassium uptake TrkH family protein
MFLFLYKKFRERIKLSIWDYIPIVHRVLRAASVFVSLFTMGVIIYFYGYPQTPQSFLFCDIVIHGSLLFYVLKYLLQTFFNVHSFRFITKNWFQGLLILSIIAWFLVFYVIDFHKEQYLFAGNGAGSFNNIAMLSVQLYFFVLMLIELSHIGNLFDKIKIGPGGLLMTSFLLLISLGTFLLLLPEMTVRNITFLDALFTSTSASCVTGLSVVDIGTVFSFKGQFVIMLLIQLGGINIVCFASFLAYFYSGAKLRYQSVVKEMLNTTLHGSRSLTREIILYTFAIGAVGLLFMFFYFISTQTFGNSLADNAFFSAFHTVSAFNNAGFSLLSDGMMSPMLRHNYYIQAIVMFLVFLGGIGFVTIHDFITTPVWKKSWWKNLQISTKIVLKLSLILILIGAVMFFILEYHSANADNRLIDKIFAAMFSAISSRTAGFNTVDFSLFNTSTRLIFIVLMFIGTAPGSTGGGIKLTTFYILYKSAIATILGKKQVTTFNKAISYEMVDRAYLVLVFSLSIIFIGTFCLSISDPQFSLEQVLFEVTSAFGTVGASVGIVPLLSDFGKFVIIFIMYIGRITVLTLALSLTRRVFNRYSLATTNIGI